MTTRSHDQNQLKLGKGVRNALCMDCGFKFKNFDLRIRPRDKLIVCKDCWEPRHPSEYYNYKAIDEGGGGIGLENPEPEDSGGTDIGGNVFPPPINITTLTITNPGYNQSYSQIVETDVADYTVDVVFTISAGTLPTGLTIETSALNGSNGLISGTATVAGDFDFTVTATHPNGQTDTQQYTGAIGIGAPDAWAASTIPNQDVGDVPGLYVVDKTYFASSGKIPGIGGHSTSQIGYKLNETAETWEAMAAYSGNSYSAGSTCVSRTADGKDYLVTYGRGGSTQYYDDALNTWTSISNQGYVDGGALANNGDEVFYFGGNIDATALYTDRIIRLDTTTWSWTTSSAVLPKKIAGHFAITLGSGNILIGGGQETNGGGATNLVCWEWNPSTLAFTTVGSLPGTYIPWNYYFLLTDGTPWIGGGYNGAGTTRSYTYDTDLQTWTEESTALPANCARYATASAQYSIWVMPSGNLLFKRLDGLASVYVSSVS